jgi:hypothetical protein
MTKDLINKNAMLCVEKMRECIITELLGLTNSTYQPQEILEHHEGLCSIRMQICASNGVCKSYILIAQSNQDLRSEAQIKSLFSSKMDLSEVEIKIEKYEG